MIRNKNLVLKIKETLGISDHALARKISIPVLELQEGVIPSEKVEVLEALLCNANSSVVTSPRVAHVPLDSKVLLGDSISLLKDLPSESIDAIISDIPYGIQLDDWDVIHDNKNKALLGTTPAQEKAGKVFAKRRKPINGWSEADKEIPKQYYDWCMTWLPDCLRVLKKRGGSIILFAGRRYNHRCVLAMEDIGFNFRDSLAWIKPQSPFRAQRLSSVLKRRGELAEACKWEDWRVGNLAPVYEPIIWGFKPYDQTIVDNVLDFGVGAMNSETFKVLTGSYSNTISMGMSYGEGGYHEAQKPVKLMECLIQLCTPEDAIILDPFADSGSTGVAALKCNRRYILMEQDSNYYDIIRKRIS